MSGPPATGAQMSNYEQAMRKQQDTIQYQLEFGDVIERIRKFLEGYYWDDFQKKYIPYLTDSAGTAIPLMQPKGINLTMRSLVALEHKGITLADLTERDALVFTQEVHKDLARTLFVHGEEVGLQPTDIKQVTKMISINIYAAFTRAIKGATADRLNKNVTIVESKTSTGKGV